MAVSNSWTYSVPVVCGTAPARDGGRLAEPIPLTEGANPPRSARAHA
ncbi:hypothetical protein [Micromonospora sp. U21]|nr:hypothetical protein [Micromonospora sp. U21]MBQ0906905.1 hypothetical protein [Micromonospora sp. U21]